MSASPFALALVVNTYNQPEYLARVLTAIERQSTLPHEVLLADDGSGVETRKVFSAWATQRRFRCEHVWQSNEGFRRARILNRTIAAAQSDYLVFLDGDSLPHPSFVSDHNRLAQRATFIQGHRALIEQRAAVWFGQGDFCSDRRRALFQGQLRGLKHAYRWPFPWRRVRSDLRGVRGCNLAIWRDDLIEINGYNEAFVGWGREDSELSLRLMNAGRRRIDVRGWSICYHLWHPPASRVGLPTNDRLLEQALASRVSSCEKGLRQHLNV